MKYHAQIHPKILHIDHTVSVSLQGGLYQSLHLLVECAKFSAYPYLAPVTFRVLPILQLHLKVLSNLLRHKYINCLLLGIHFRFDNLCTSLHLQLFFEFADLLSQPCHFF
jgi:hypothetical protein